MRRIRTMGWTGPLKLETFSGRVSDDKIRFTNHGTVITRSYSRDWDLFGKNSREDTNGK